MSSLVAEKYGYALFEVAKEQDRLNEFRKESKKVRKIFSEAPVLYQVLEHPEVDKDEKKEILKKIFEDELSKEMLNFLYVTVDKNRTRHIDDILKEYDFLYREENNIKEALMITSVPATREQMKNMKELLERKTGGTVYLENKVDRSILGGVILELDGRRMDNSISHELEQMKFRIKEASL